jgi:hypothetical protein
MFLYTIKIKDFLDLFVSCYLILRIKGEKDLNNYIIRADDWVYCIDILLFISFLNILVKINKKESS